MDRDCIYTRGRETEPRSAVNSLPAIVIVLEWDLSNSLLRTHHNP